MIYMKHTEHGNAHFDDALQAEKEAQGWVRWPRTPEQKAGTAQEPAKAEAVAKVKRSPGRPPKVKQ